MTGVISVVLLVAGLAVVLGSCAGMAVLDDPLDRLHLTTPAAMLGSTGICASIVVDIDMEAGTALVHQLAGAPEPDAHPAAPG